MPDRTINFGESETEATYQIQDTDGAAGGGNFVVAKDTNANTVLLEYQPGSDTWQYAGDVDMGGGDITNVNGLTASSAIIGGTVTATDVNTDSVNTDSASVTNQLDAGSVNTEQASIGTVSNQGGVFRLVDRETPSSDTSQIQFTGLSNNAEYRLFYQSFFDTTESDIIARINGDGASTGNYFYWDASGTKQTSENEFLLASITGNTSLGGTVVVTPSDFTTGAREGFNNQFTPGGVPARITDFGREGGRDNNDSLSSIELIAGDDWGGGRTLVELWERDYS